MTLTAKELQAEIEANGVIWTNTEGDKTVTVRWEEFRAEAGDADHTLKDGTEIKGVAWFRKNEYIYNIFKIGDQHYRTTGDYDSWNGTTWDYTNIEEVYPKEITKTVWSTKP